MLKCADVARKQACLFLRYSISLSHNHLQYTTEVIHSSEFAVHYSSVLSVIGKLSDQNRHEVAAFGSPVMETGRLAFSLPE